MIIDWAASTPWRSLAGGAIIGGAVTMFALANGRIAGISGIVGGLLRPTHGDVAWRLAFVAGIAGAPIVYALAATPPAITIAASYPVLAIAGFLVGVGTRYGAGCTSGHGVCGMARLSPRSIVATMTFMLAGIFTVFVVRHLLAA